MAFDPTDRCLSAVSSIQPVELRADSAFQFRCHPGIACFNACCKNIDITLTPYDILRLKRHFGMTSKEFVAEYTIPFEMDADGMPGLKLRTKPGATECAFLGERDCTVYDERPVACRYYALGNMGVRRKDETKVEDMNQVLFGAETIPIRQGARERRIRKRKAVWAARRRDTAARHRKDLEKQQYGE